ncbi:universal stress protein [Myxococcota bacterium]|nr:universal stress protein [Myxococcota bacterium]MBU1431109.1 universal stress protein [Myxococcota bacterium]MBU1897105.1 universal stress protein [Myxococcota bacterium]
MSTILIPVDFSDCSHPLVDEAVKAAREEGAALLLLHVIQPAEVAGATQIHLKGGETCSVEDYLRRDALAQMKTYAAQLEGIEAELRVTQGEIIEEILTAAADPAISKIMMSTRGRQGVMRWLYGSVTEAIKSKTDKPVIAIRTQHKSTCLAGSCATCASGTTEARYQARAEQDG